MTPAASPAIGLRRARSGGIRSGIVMAAQEAMAKDELARLYEVTAALTGYVQSEVAR